MNLDFHHARTCWKSRFITFVGYRVGDEVGRTLQARAAFAPQRGQRNGRALATRRIAPVTMNGNRSLGIVRVPSTGPWVAQRLGLVWKDSWLLVAVIRELLTMRVTWTGVSSGSDERR